METVICLGDCSGAGVVCCVSLTSKWLWQKLYPHPLKQLSLTLHGEHGPGADLPSTVPGLTGICARVLWEHLLDTQAVPATLLLEVEVL